MEPISERGFTADVGTLLDSLGQSVVCEVREVRVAGGSGEGAVPCMFRPSVDFARAAAPRNDFTLVAAGRRLRIQLRDVGVNLGSPYAQGAVIGLSPA